MHGIEIQSKCGHDSIRVSDWNVVKHAELPDEVNRLGIDSNRATIKQKNAGAALNQEIDFIFHDHYSSSCSAQPLNGLDLRHSALSIQQSAGWQSCLRLNAEWRVLNAFASGICYSAVLWITCGPLGDTRTYQAWRRVLDACFARLRRRRMTKKLGSCIVGSTALSF